MRAVQLNEIGHPLVDSQCKVPPLGPGDVLVRVVAAGICHSDAHYRAGTSSVSTTPMTLGHEVAGVVEAVGGEVDTSLVNQRVCIHYLVTCGACEYCRSGQEQFCPSGEMIGKHRPGGYAEYIVVPSRNAVPVPTNVSDAQAAIMMCSTATSYHALRQARLASGESIAVIGCGGLGMSAIQLALAMGAGQVLAVDVDDRKLSIARSFGAQTIDGKTDPLAAIRGATSGRGVDVAVELIGKRQTFELAVASLGPKGRAALAGISSDAIVVRPYPDIINREAEIIGVSDHHLSELQTILEWASQGRLNLSSFISQTVPLESEAINGVLDALEAGTSSIRTVITP